MIGLAAMKRSYSLSIHPLIETFFLSFSLLNLHNMLKTPPYPLVRSYTHLTGLKPGDVGGLYPVTRQDDAELATATREAERFDNGRRHQGANTTWAGYDLGILYRHDTAAPISADRRRGLSPAVSTVSNRRQSTHHTKQNIVRLADRNHWPARRCTATLTLQAEILSEEAKDHPSVAVPQRTERARREFMGSTSESVSHTHTICRNQQQHTADNATGLPMTQPCGAKQQQN